MNTEKIREMSIEEILVRIQEENDELTRSRLNHAVSAIQNPMVIRNSRRAIARLITVLREKELQELNK
jgi:large subunit ribosomal protein L29